MHLSIARQKSGSHFVKTDETRGTGREKKRNFRRGKQTEKNEIWEIAWQSPVERWILNRLNPESCNNNAGDNNNQRSQYHAVHDFTLRFLFNE